MVRLLRQLRESALSKPNFIRYVSYALGEIILIAVGILIAVQIDDWNESRNMRKLEINALEAIAASLEESTNNLEEIISGHPPSYGWKHGTENFCLVVISSQRYHSLAGGIMLMRSSRCSSKRSISNPADTSQDIRCCMTLRTSVSFG